MVWGSNAGGGERFFSSPKCLGQPCSPNSTLLNKYWGSLPEVKWLGHEIDPSPTLVLTWRMSGPALQPK